MRSTRVALLTRHGKSDPQHGFLRHLNHSSLFVPTIRDYYEIILSEKLALVSKEITKSVDAPGFLVRHYSQPYRLPESLT